MTSLIFLLPAAAAALLASRPGFAVILEGTATSSQPLPDELRSLWPDRFTSTSAAKKAVRRKLILLEDEATTIDAAVTPGVRIQILARVAAGPAAGEGRRGRCAEPLRCCYEDDQLAVVFKPPGISVQGGVRARLPASLTPSTAYLDEPLWRPQHVHRLDSPTSGLVLVAKTGRALRTLSASFAAREVHKQYRAIVAGDVAAAANMGPNQEGEQEREPTKGAPAREQPTRGIACGSVSVPLSGKWARTEWVQVACVPCARYGHVSVVDLYPISGRTHQLRRHMASLGCPILGDARYWPQELPWPEEVIPRPTTPAATGGGDAADAPDAAEVEEAGGTAGGQVLMLTAVQLELPHPVTQDPLCVRTEPPDDFARVLEALSEEVPRSHHCDETVF